MSVQKLTRTRSKRLLSDFISLRLERSKLSTELAKEKELILDWRMTKMLSTSPLKSDYFKIF